MQLESVAVLHTIEDSCDENMQQWLQEIWKDSVCAYVIKHTKSIQTKQKRNIVPSEKSSANRQQMIWCDFNRNIK